MLIFDFRKMKRYILLIAFLMPLLVLNKVTYSQQDSNLYKIAIFAPLYLDSAFDSMDNYRYAKNQFPDFFSPGLEFYEGAQLALDSLSKEGVNLEVFIYDNKSSQQPISEQLQKPELQDVDLILTHCSSNELRFYTDFGLEKSIPVINVNLPNDGGVRANPFFVMLNSTLKTQVEATCRHVQRYYSTSPYVVFRKKGMIEDVIRNYMTDFSKTATTPFRVKYVDLPDSFTVNHLMAQLDSNQQTICIAGSLNETFGKRLARHLAAINKDYPVKAVGMPTWDAVRDFNKPEYKDLEIIYCTPFYNARTDRVSNSIVSHFTNVLYARPSDMVMRGYEATWRFAKLLDKYGRDLSSNLTRREFNLFREFDIQPVLVNPDSPTLDYFENKKLYFLKWQNGTIKAVY
jgi:hypothetical protein